MLMTNPLLPANPLLPDEEPSPKNQLRNFGGFDLIKLVSMIFGSIIQLALAAQTNGYFTSNNGTSSTLTTLKVSLSALSITATFVSLFATLTAAPHSSFPTFRRIFLQFWPWLFMAEFS